MAKQPKGILGGITGRIGNVVGGSWNGISVLRQAPSPGRTRFSRPQIEQQARFILITRFLRPVSELINQTFKHSAKRMSCFNKAFSVNKETVTGLYPSFKINYAAVLLSSGNLSNAGNIKTSSPKPGCLLVSWNTKTSPKFGGSGSDRAFIAAYCEDLDRWLCHFNSTRRSEGSCNLNISDFKGRQVQAYMGFVSENGKKASNSLYLGKLNIS